MRSGRVTWGAALGISVAAVLAACCLAGVPLYTSAAASAAVQDQLRQTCASDSALRLYVPADQSIDPVDVRALGDSVPHVQPSILQVTSRVTIGPGGSRPLILLYRDGAERNVDPSLSPLGPNEIAMSEGNLRLVGRGVGDHLATVGANGEDVDFVITQTFGDVPILPEPSFWCGNRKMLRPNAHGDPPPPWGLVSVETQRSIGGPAVAGFEFRASTQPLTMHEASEMNRGYERAQALSVSRFAPGPGVGQGGVSGSRPSSELPTLLSRATALSTAVDKSISTARLAGLAASGLVLVAAAVMLARERRRELRLLSLRGAPPWRSAAGLAPVVGAPILAGMAAGSALAFVGVRVLGPAPQIERAAVWQAAESVVVASVVAVVVAAVTAALTGDWFVDGGHRIRRLWRKVPFELIVVALALISFRRLDRVGGLRMFGVESRGGELLAQGFPLFAIAAIAAIVFRPLRSLATRVRLTGSRLPRGMRLGWRRAVIEPGLASALVVATAVACGCFTLSSVLSASSRQQLDDKAITFVGADMAVNVLDDVALPEGLADRATKVLRFKGRVAGASFDVLGVDRATFLRVAHLGPDASTESLGELLTAITPTDGALRAVLVGPVPGDGFGQAPIEVEKITGAAGVTLDVVATARFFPGYQTGVTLAVVDRDALAAQIDGVRRAIWLHDPPADAVDQIRAQGARVVGVINAAEVFDSTSYSAQRWSYAPLGALGVLFAAVAITLQLLVIEARRDSRRMSHVVMKRTGFGRRSLWISSAVEVGLPLAGGAFVGIVGGIASAAMSIRRLDPLPNLQPPARLVAPVEAFLAVAAVIVVATIGLAALTVRSTTRGDPMEAIRATA